jgi:hypothetical protein
LLVEFGLRTFSFTEEFEDDQQVFDGSTYFYISFCPEFNGFDFLENYLGFFGVVPEIGLVGNLFLFLDQ